jgi:hypothetical protein
VRAPRRLRLAARWKATGWWRLGRR